MPRYAGVERHDPCLHNNKVSVGKSRQQGPCLDANTCTVCPSFSYIPLNAHKICTLELSLLHCCKSIIECTTNHEIEAIATLLDRCTLRFAWLAIPMNLRPIHQRQENQVYQLVDASYLLRFILVLFIFIQHALHGLPPWRWTLPQNFILKMQNHNIDSRFFTNEIEVYGRLTHLQGRQIPRLYGIVKIRKAGKLYDALLLEELDGIPLTNCAQSSRSLSALQDKVFQAFEGISQARIVHGEIELRNILVVDDDIRIIDFEYAEVRGSKEEAEEQNKIDLRTMFRNSAKKWVE